MSCGCVTGTLIVGTRPTLELEFRDEDDALADPTSITVRVLPPSGTVVEYATPHATITQTSTGLWEFQFPLALTEAGEYWVYVVGSGGGTDVAAQASFTLHDTHVPLA